MLRLASMIYSFIATTLAGSALIAALVMGVSDWVTLVGAAAAGAVIAMPFSYYVASRMISNAA